MPGFRSIAKDCAGRFQGREEWGATRELAAAHLFARWPDEPACSTITADGPTRDRCLSDGTLTPAGDDGTEYHPKLTTVYKLAQRLNARIVYEEHPGSNLPPDRNVYGE